MLTKFNYIAGIGEAIFSGNFALNPEINHKMQSKTEKLNNIPLNKSWFREEIKILIVLFRN